MNHINLEDWLISEAGPGDVPAGGPPMSQPGGPGDPMGQDPGAAGPQAGQPDPQAQPPGGPPAPDEGQEDVTQDPHAPDMPDDVNDEEDNMEVFKKKFLKESIKGQVNTLINLLQEVRDRDLNPLDRKFVEDNLQIQYVRLQSNILDASKEIRRSINEQLDKNNPASSLVNIMQAALEKQPMLSNIFIKIMGYFGMKGDIHRKFIAAMLGAAQVGTGQSKPDLLLEDNDYTVYISTRVTAEFGKYDLGKWHLTESDPEHFLSEPERKKLENGSPEEKEVLRHRIVMESICKAFHERAFLLTTVGEDGTIYNMGVDLETCLKGAYMDGKLVIRTKESEDSEAMIDSNGTIVPFLDLDIKYTRDSGEVDEAGKSSTKEVPFLQRKDGMLFLVATLDVLKEASTTLQGLVIKETPYAGNPSDISKIMRSTYSIAELISKPGM
jgi:hypothetical protein